MMKLLLTLVILVMGDLGAEINPLDATRSDQFAKLAMAGLDREFPNKPADVLTSLTDVKRPRVVHPAFFGSFDWHSSVHGHWLLVRLLKLQPGMPAAAEARALLDAHFSAGALATEAAYLEKKENRSFERMYGWAWALRLATELRSWDDADATRWAKNFQPLEKKLVDLVKGYLPRLTYAIRTGVHPDTAFALAQMLDYSRGAKDRDLELMIVARARDYYVRDRAYSPHFEPSGEDFFSPGLNVADLMRRVLPRAEFAAWLGDFFPGLGVGDLGAWAKPAEVSDLSDPRIVHLVGLNLSRAWTMQGIASSLDDADPRRAILQKTEALHAEAGVRHVFSGHYEGEHWLATFAVYYLTKAGLAD